MSRAWFVVALLVLAGWKPEWRWEHPTPHGGSIAAMAGSGTRLYAVGARGAILASRDAGETWSPIASGVVEDLHAIARGNVIVAVGARGRILRSRDGVAFEVRAAGTTAELVGVAVRDDTVVVVTGDGGVLRSTDAGAQFAVLPGVAKQTSRATAIAIAASGIFVGTADGLFRSTDDGTTFTAVATEPVQQLAVDSNTIYALAGTQVRYDPVMACGSCIGASYETAALYRSTDGARWQRRVLADPTTTARSWGPPTVPAPPTTPPGGVFRGHGGVRGPITTAPWGPRALAIGAGEVYASAEALHVSRDRGATFTTAAARRGALVATGAALVAAGEHGALAVSRDRGASWREITRRTVAESNLFAIAAAPNGRAFAVGMDGQLVARAANGTWTKVAVPTGKYQRLEAVHAIDDKTVIVVGERGVILVSTDGGRTFQHRASARTANLTAVWGLGDEVFAGGRDTLLHSRDRGATWHVIPSKLYSVYRFWGGALDDIYRIGDGLFHSSDRGVTWREVDPALGGMYAGIWGSSAGDIFLVGYKGKILHSADRGKTWTPRTSGTTRDLRGIWGHGNHVFVIGDGIVLHSSDRGVTWAEEPVPADVSLFAVTGTADAVYLLGEGAAILRLPLR